MCTFKLRSSYHDCDEPEYQVNVVLVDMHLLELMQIQKGDSSFLQHGLHSLKQIKLYMTTTVIKKGWGR